MANIKIDLGHPVIEGMPLSFRAPCNCTEVTGIKVSYPNGDNTAFIVFSFADAHGNNLAGLGNLFAAGAMVRVVLDKSSAKAFIQNADTNKYLEGKFASKAPASHVTDKNNPHGVTPAQIGAVPTTRKVNGKALSADITLGAGDVGADAAGAAAGVQNNLNAHTSNKNNPHGVTYAQVGAAPAPIISQTDINAGSTALETGRSYHVYE